MVLINISAANFLRLGLEAKGFGPSRQGSLKVKLRRFHSAYGLAPQTLSVMFHDLQTTQVAEARIDDPDYKDFLLAVFWMKTYMVEEDLAGFFDVSEKTARTHIWKYVTEIRALKAEMIVWPDFEESEEEIIFSVDTVHSPIQEQRRNPDRRWSSYKFKKPALAYEVAIKTWEDECIWVRGPFKGGTKDLPIFMGEVVPLFEEEEDNNEGDDNNDDDDGDVDNWFGDEDDDDDEDYVFEEREDIPLPYCLCNQIPEGKVAYGDQGYIGAPRHKVIGPNIADTEDVQQFKQRLGARHESFNKRLKSFKILEERFRHGIKKHPVVFEAIVVMVNYDMKHGRPLFQL